MAGITPKVLCGDALAASSAEAASGKDPQVSLSLGTGIGSPRCSRARLGSREKRVKGFLQSTPPLAPPPAAGLTTLRCGIYPGLCNTEGDKRGPCVKHTPQKPPDLRSE